MDHIEPPLGGQGGSAFIDLRSDTVTKPTPAMLEAMMKAEVGDDVFEEDPTVKALEEKAAAMFGMEAALFCASGTMCNQVAIKIHTQPLDEIICEKTSHIYYYEVGGFAYNSNCSIRLIDGDRGRIHSQDIVANINPDNVHVPTTSLVVLENTHNKGGGSYYTMDAMKNIFHTCLHHNLFLHLDGARLFNALVESSHSVEDSCLEIGRYFNSISFCLSKGLGAPVGSVLVSSKDKIKMARRVRKVMGGGMRQAGFLAAAGIYALDHNIGRLKEDHHRAKKLGREVSSLPYVKQLLPVDTNIIVFTLQSNVDSSKFLNYLFQHNIKAVPFGKNTIRFVTHLNIDDDMIDKTVTVLKEFKA